MPNEREVTRLYKWKPLASRPKGRPKNRWEDDVRMDLQKMKMKNWKRSVLDRNLCRTIVERKSCSVYQEEEEEELDSFMVGRSFLRI
jgi:hypothetical protein